MRKRGQVFVAVLALTAMPPRVSAQSDTPPAVGFYLGIIAEQATLGGERVRAREEESWRFGLHVGQWSVGYAGKTLSSGVAVVTVNAPATVMPQLHVQGVEVARAFRPSGRVQPTLSLLLGSATIEARRLALTSPAAGSTTWESLGRASGAVIEVAGGVSVPVWKMVRLDGRVGVRVGKGVTIETRDYTPTAFFMNSSFLVGWLGDWRKH